MNRTTKSTKKKPLARVFKPRKLDLQVLELLSGWTGIKWGA